MENPFLPKRFGKVERIGELTESDELREAKEILNEVDWEVLKDIFITERQRSGVHGSNDEAFCDKNLVKIEEMNSRDTGGSFNSETREIRINPWRYRIDTEPKDTGARNPKFTYGILSGLIHEETHAAGYVGPSGVHIELMATLKSLLTRKRIPLNQVGYSYDEAQNFKLKGMFNQLFNEAITDKIAEDVYREYIQRVGLSGGSEYFVVGYATGRAMVEAFVLHMAEAAELPREVVWNAIKAGYFEGIDLTSTKMANLFSSLAMEEIMQLLPHVNTPDQAVLLMSKLKFSSPADKSKEEILVGLESFKEYLENARLHGLLYGLPEKVRDQLFNARIAAKSIKKNL